MEEKLVNFDGFIYFRKTMVEQIEEATELLDSATINQLEDRMEAGENALWLNVSVFIPGELNDRDLINEKVLEVLTKHFVENTPETLDSIDIDNYGLSYNNN